MTYLDRGADTIGRLVTCTIALAAMAVLAIAVLAVLPTGAAAAPAKDTTIPGHYIVVLKDSVDHPGAIARAQTEQRDGDLGFVYGHALKGYSAELSKGAVEALRHDPRVDYVTPDREVEVFSQVTPTGISRIFAAEREDLDIDEADDLRVDADVAVIDTGVDPVHPDLDVVERTNCSFEVSECTDGTGIDKFGHGTHVAGIVGAIDNGFGVVGVAPGARIWSVKVLNDNGAGSDSTIIAGIDWVTAHAGEIEVANMSLGHPGSSPPWDEAISDSVDAGVVYAAAAGNDNEDAANYTPASGPDVITVSALADYDGKAGGDADPVCSFGTPDGADDTLANYSNWGEVIEVTAPGTCIYSTRPTTGSLYGSNYGYGKGTSMASPHVAGAAAILASESNPDNREDVEAIREEIIGEGSLNWDDDSGDGAHEPLLDLRAPAPEAVTLPATGLQTHSAKLNAVVSAGGLSSTYRFEYGTSTEYGKSTPVQSLGSGTGDLELGERIAVEPETTYHYRVVVTSSAGTFSGEDRTFVISPWSIQPTPAPSGEEGKWGELNDVSCASGSECMAVGKKSVPYKGGSPYTPVPFAQRWNGNSWSIVAVPAPAGAYESRLESVSCPSASFCMATGTYLLDKPEARPQPFAAHWDGSQWSLLSVPAPSGASEGSFLKDVACASASACVAVGHYVVSGLTDERTLVESWNGTEWTLQPSIAVEGKALVKLAGVSCSSSTQCTAVGGMKESFLKPEAPLAARWNGAKWSLQTPAALPKPGGFTDVFCPAAAFCMAVGGSLTHGVAETWNGVSWQLVVSGLPSKLTEVACASGISCDVLAGVSGQHWDGSSWSAQNPAMPERGSDVALRGISCPAAGACTTVGSYYRNTQAGGGSKPLAERLTPKWSLQASQENPGIGKVPLADVSCPSAGACMAVGKRSNGAIDLGYSSFWNGTKWVEWGASSRGSLESVACTSTSFCLAVGNANDGGSTSEVWNGSAWSHRATPDPSGATEIDLRNVSCASSSACIAVGAYHQSGVGKRPMAMRFGGSNWSAQSVPYPSGAEGGDGELSDVACATASECIAVGRKTLSGTTVPFAERWNGSFWSILGVPVPAEALESSLEDLTCTSSSFCMATGSYRKWGGEKQPFAARWDGSKWLLLSVPVPTEAKEGAFLKSISCASASSCIAVGHYVVSGFTNERTLVESWNGTEWTLQPSIALEGKALVKLAGVSCSSSTQCTAVGSAMEKLFTPFSPLAARWNGSTWANQTMSGRVMPLAEVSCPVASACMAVGGASNGTINLGYTGHWNGAKWVDAGTSSRGALAAVSCATATFCAAIGKANDGSLLAEIWDGSAWSYKAPSNPTGGTEVELRGVSCTASNACTAVGSYYDSTVGYRPLAQRWNGSSWSIQPTPAPSGEEGKWGELNDVSCASGSECMAVGKKSVPYKGGSPYTPVPFAQRWNGSSWSIVAVPAPAGAYESRLEDVSCPSASFCMATGTYFIDKPEARQQPFAARWDGSKWSILSVPAPSGASEGSFLKDVACASASACIAVGYDKVVGFIDERTVVESWDGAEWALQPSIAVEGKALVKLAGVSCSSSVQCTAVGSAMEKMFTPFLSLTARWE